MFMQPGGQWCMMLASACGDGFFCAAFVLHLVTLMNSHLNL